MVERQGLQKFLGTQANPPLEKALKVVRAKSDRSRSLGERRGVPKIRLQKL
jgi:hypothetical protein